MLSMAFASLGWGTWWIVVLLRSLDRELVQDLLLPSVVSALFAALGLAIAVLTLRARRAWVLFTLFPLVANASLLAMPWLAPAVFATRP
jgi:hypothetical protein